MKRLNKKYILLGALLICVALAILLISRFNFRKKSFIGEIREATQPQLDTLSKKLASKNQLHRKIETLINTGQLNAARLLIDSTSRAGVSEDFTHVYKGMIFQKEKKLETALQEYNLAMSEEEFPFALEHRANLFIEMNRLDFGDFADIDPPISLQIDPPKLTVKKSSREVVYLL